VINFIVYLYDKDSETGRGISKKFQWPVLPRVGEYIKFDRPDEWVTVEVTEICHNFGHNARIEVKCENVYIEFLRQMYKSKNGWKLSDTTEEWFFSDDVE
jgi:hypothetical protein